MEKNKDSLPINEQVGEMFSKKIENMCNDERFSCKALLSIIFFVAVVISSIVPVTTIFITTDENCLRCFDYHERNGTAEMTSVIFYNVITHQCLTHSVSCTLGEENTDLPSCTEYISDKQFCGMRECQFKELLPGLRPIPYWLIVYSSLLGFAISSVINVFLFSVWKPFQEHVLHVLDEEYIRLDPMFHSSYFALKAFGLMNPYVYLFKFAFFIINFVLICKARFDDKSTNAWIDYQIIYASLVNSGSFELVLHPLIKVMVHTPTERSIAIEKGLLDEDKYDPHKQNLTDADFAVLERIGKLSGFDAFEKYEKCTSYPICAIHEKLKVIPQLGILILLPFIGSHTAPMIFVYLPMMGVPTAIAAPFYYLSRKVMHSPSLRNVLATLSGLVFTTLWFQTASFYAILFYQGVGWSDVWGKDLEKRDTSCYFNAIGNSLTIYSMNFVSLFFS